MYPLQIDFDKKDQKKRLFHKLYKNKIKLQVHYIPIHLQPYYRKNFGFKYGDFYNAEKFYESQVSIPIYPGLSKNDQDYVIDRFYHELYER